jgi:hypothetical protein
MSDEALLPKKLSSHIFLFYLFYFVIPGPDPKTGSGSAKAKSSGSGSTPLHSSNFFSLLPFTDQPGVNRRLQGLLPGRAPEDGLGPHG